MYDKGKKGKGNWRMGNGIPITP